MGKKSYKDIARKKLEKKESISPKPRYYDERPAQEGVHSSTRTSLGYVIFTLVVIVGAIVAVVALNQQQDQEDDNPLAPVFDNDDGPSYTPPEDETFSAPSTGIQTGDTVKLSYKMWSDKDGDGQVNPELQAPDDEGTFEPTITDTSLIYGFYKNVLGMEEGQTKEFYVPPEEGYTQPGHQYYGVTLYFWVETIDIK